MVMLSIFFGNNKLKKSWNTTENSPFCICQNLKLFLNKIEDISSFISLHCV